MAERLPAFLLRLEGAAVFAAAIVLYFHADYQWWLFLVLLLAPDLSAAGYLRSPRIGAAVYDMGHFDGFPVALGVAGVLSDNDRAMKLALVWLAHIGWIAQSATG